MVKGVVKWFDYSQGAGAIAPENGGAEVLVHFSAVKSKKQRTLHPGQRVQFQIGTEAGVVRATHVEILDEVAAPEPFVEPAATLDPATPVASNARASNAGHRSGAHSGGRAKLWPLGVAGLAIIGGLFVAANSKRNVPSSARVAAVSPVVSTAVATTSPSPIASRPAAKKSATAKSAEIFQGEQFPQTRTRLMSVEEVNALTPAQLRYALSEIYARHGYGFSQRRQSKPFRRLAWYKPVAGRTEAASWQQFSDLEKSNARILGQIRSERQEQQVQAQRQARAYKTEQLRQSRQAEQNRAAQQVAQQRSARAWQEAPPETTAPAFTRPETVPDVPGGSVDETPNFGSSDDFTATGKPIFTGPRGGRFHISASGKKVYEKRR